MARLAVFFVAFAALLVNANCEEFVPKLTALRNVKADGPKGLQGIPKVIESNLPASLNNVALSYAQKTLDNAANLVAASKQLQTKLASYDQTQRWSVAIEPAAYFVTGNYFAHYLVNNYNVFLYSVACRH